MHQPRKLFSVLYNMGESYFEERISGGIDFSKIPFATGEYEDCQFVHCNISGVDLSSCRFLNCLFTDCNLSLAKLEKTVVQDTTFTRCKLLGLRFDQCSSFGLSFQFDHCLIDHASFFGTKIKSTKFQNCRLNETDFTDCDLTGAVFAECDLTKTIFENSILQKADLRTAINYTIDPERNRLKGAKFSFPEVIRLLDKYGIHVDLRG